MLLSSVTTSQREGLFSNTSEAPNDAPGPAASYLEQEEDGGGGGERRYEEEPALLSFAPTRPDLTATSAGGCPGTKTLLPGGSVSLSALAASHAAASRGRREKGWIWLRKVTSSSSREGGGARSGDECEISPSAAAAAGEGAKEREVATSSTTSFASSHAAEIAVTGGLNDFPFNGFSGANTYRGHLRAGQGGMRRRRDAEGGRESNESWVIYHSVSEKKKYVVEPTFLACWWKKKVKKRELRHCADSERSSVHKKTHFDLRKAASASGGIRFRAGLGEKDDLNLLRCRCSLLSSPPTLQLPSPSSSSSSTQSRPSLSSRQRLFRRPVATVDRGALDHGRWRCTGGYGGGGGNGGVKKTEGC